VGPADGSLDGELLGVLVGSFVGSPVSGALNPSETREAIEGKEKNSVLDSTKTTSFVCSGSLLISWFTAAHGSSTNPMAAMWRIIIE
jgi:hypothetical protein